MASNSKYVSSILVAEYIPTQSKPILKYINLNNLSFFYNLVVETGCLSAIKMLCFYGIEYQLVCQRNLSLQYVSDECAAAKRGTKKARVGQIGTRGC